jgi:5-methylcytosine-specific restriction protein A
MWQADPKQLAHQLSEHFGVHLEGTGGRSSTGLWLELTPAGFHSNDSFRLRLELGWRSIRASFVPGPFAGHLISEMGQAAAGRTTFSGLAEKCLTDKATISMAINGTEVSPVDSISWAPTWQRLDLVLEKSPLAINTEDHEENDRQLGGWARRFTGLVLCLIPMEEIEQSIDLNPEGLPEGGSLRVEVNRYERSHINRANCIEIQGAICKACSFDFERVYGPIGRGFIHVHHVTPVSQIGAGYVIDPATDLVPLCPNCHAMVHRSDPPLDVDTLRRYLGETAGNKSPD